jgi:hypothetical protein
MDSSNFEPKYVGQLQDKVTHGSAQMLAGGMLFPTQSVQNEVRVCPASDE